MTNPTHLPPCPTCHQRIAAVIAPRNPRITGSTAMPCGHPVDVTITGPTDALRLELSTA